MNEYPYLENIIFIWGQTIVPPAVLVGLFLTGKQKGLKIQTIVKFFAAFFIFVLLKAFLKSWAQYSVWESDARTKFLLPPHEPTYFYNYVFFRFFLEHTIALAAAFIFGGFLFLLYRLSQGAMLMKPEVFLGMFFAFLVGWPAVIILVPAVFLGMIGWGLSTRALARFYPKIGVKKRLAMTPFLFAAAFALLFSGDALIRIFHLTVFKITS